MSKITLVKSIVEEAVRTTFSIAYSKQAVWVQRRICKSEVGISYLLNDGQVSSIDHKRGEIVVFPCGKIEVNENK